MENKSPKFDFDDILIQPAVISNINSRKTVSVMDDNKMLPLFTAPMDTVTDLSHRNIFTENLIYSIVPRTESRQFSREDFRTIKGWAALSLDQFEQIFGEGDCIPDQEVIKVCIDIANGHMKRLKEMVERTKDKYQDRLLIMVGNVANPATFFELSQAGADFVRIGVGNGSGCSTSVHTGIGYPLASLINDIYHKKAGRSGKFAKVIADGGIKKYADIIKALALGADYVMCGGIFNKALESAGHTYSANKKFEGYTVPGDRVDQYSNEVKTAFNMGSVFYKKFRGMSTKEVQAHLGNELRSSEGVTRMIQVEYTLSGWVENFIDYLSSAMSYTDSKDLHSFIGKPDWNLITQNSLNRFNK
ncbi:MAG: IMP dehydrogenase [Saccharofermentanaceae bacterium]|jgi:IMP dehydrogenase/GMP reductase|nr:IMP dehydrogenase [Bacteroidales bacterium]